MPGEQLIRTAIGLPWTIARRVLGLVPGIPNPHKGDSPHSADHPSTSGSTGASPHKGVRPLSAERAAAEALQRDREPREEAIFTPDDDFFDDDEHVESEVEVVAESADPEAADAPGPQFHVDEPWEGYRRMKVAEIVTRLEGQTPEVLAAVELYETTHRKRRGVLDAVRDAARS